MLAQMTLQQAGNPDDHLISAGVAQPVVDLLEIIRIQHDKRKVTAGSTALHFADNLILKGNLIQQAGQLIHDGLLRKVGHHSVHRSGYPPYQHQADQNKDCRKSSGKHRDKFLQLRIFPEKLCRRRQAYDFPLIFADCHADKIFLPCNNRRLLSCDRTLNLFRKRRSIFLFLRRIQNITVLIDQADRRLPEFLRVLKNMLQLFCVEGYEQYGVRIQPFYIVGPLRISVQAELPPIIASFPVDAVGKRLIHAAVREHVIGGMRNPSDRMLVRIYDCKIRKILHNAEINDPVQNAFLHLQHGVFIQLRT